MRELIIGKLIFLAFNAAAIAGVSALLFGSGLRRLTTTTTASRPIDYDIEEGSDGLICDGRERSLQTVSVDVDRQTRFMGYVLLVLLVVMFGAQLSMLLDVLVSNAEVPTWSER